MKKRLGVWLDCEKAYLISFLGEDVRIERVDSPVEGRVRFRGESKAFSRLGGMLVHPAKKKLERKKHQFKEYFDLLSSKMQGVDEIFLFGPAGTSRKLMKDLCSRTGFRDVSFGMEKSDKMTVNQMIAKAKDYFATSRSNLNKGRA